jgi:hypothetical protein
VDVLATGRRFARSSTWSVIHVSEHLVEVCEEENQH